MAVRARPSDDASGSDGAEAFESAARGYVEQCKASAACVRLLLSENATEPGSYLLFSEWTSSSAALAAVASGSDLTRYDSKAYVYRASGAPTGLGEGDLAGKEPSAGAPRVPVLVATTFRVTGEEIAPKFHAIASSLVGPSSRRGCLDEGCISYGYYRIFHEYKNATPQQRFVYFEEWESRDLLWKHLQTPATQGLFAVWPTYVTDAEYAVYDVEDYREHEAGGAANATR